MRNFGASVSSALRCGIFPRAQWNSRERRYSDGFMVTGCTMTTTLIGWVGRGRAEKLQQMDHYLSILGYPVEFHGNEVHQCISVGRRD